MSYITNLPVNNKFNVTATFGQKGSMWKNGHKGVDITAADKKLYSMCDGIVTYQGYDKSWGYYVSVMPNGFERIRIILCHMVKGSIKVKKGDKVFRTTVLGTMGTTGNSTGVHVHVEMRIDNTAVDPTPYLKVENKIASNLDGTDYKTTAAESNEILQEMLDKFDGKTEPATDYKALYEQKCAEISKLKAEADKLAAQVKDLTANNNVLNSKISAAKAALN
ncbi:MAG: M23 family metallopeptidase [Oscillospiraceae bacterium]|nr:M23 family metallopeptidase [Oscillospiraceae bacterium]MBQ8338539.1 M23 family metallopeptidase [Oscillospiraceae bacterium]